MCIYKSLTFFEVEHWLFTIGYSLAYGAVLAKMWRIYQIFHNPQPKKKVIVHIHNQWSKLTFSLSVDFSRLEVDSHCHSNCSRSCTFTFNRGSSSLLERSGSACRRQRNESWNERKNFVVACVRLLLHRKLNTNTVTLAGRCIGIFSVTTM